RKRDAVRQRDRRPCKWSSRRDKLHGKVGTLRVKDATCRGRSPARCVHSNRSVHRRRRYSGRGSTKRGAIRSDSALADRIGSGGIASCGAASLPSPSSLLSSKTIRTYCVRCLQRRLERASRHRRCTLWQRRVHPEVTEVEKL